MTNHAVILCAFWLIALAAIRDAIVAISARDVEDRAKFLLMLISASFNAYLAVRLWGLIP